VFLDSGWPSSARVEKPYPRTNELLKILVTRYDNNIEILFETFGDESSDYVVCLESRYSYDRNSVSFEELAYALHSTVEIRLKLICQFFASSLVGRVPFVTKGKP